MNRGVGVGPDLSVRFDRTTVVTVRLTAMASKTSSANKWHHYTKGTRVGEWTTTEFASRTEALAWAHARGVDTVVTEIPSHSTLSRERVTVLADGREVSEFGTVI